MPEVERCWGFFFSKNNGRTAVAILDNSYRKCYNKCNDDNKKVISHQTGKNALQSVFPLWGINSRRAAKNAVQRIYIKYGNTKWHEMYAVQGQHTIIYIEGIYNIISICL